VAGRGALAGRGAPHGRWHSICPGAVLQPRHPVGLQTKPEGQSLLVVQVPHRPQPSLAWQTQSPWKVCEQKHGTPETESFPQNWAFPSKHGAQGAGHDGDGGYCAKAGVDRLVRTGADQATAAPAPIRLSILRLDMAFFTCFSSPSGQGKPRSSGGVSGKRTELYIRPSA
jgi:hypothetical protein